MKMERQQNYILGLPSTQGPAVVEIPLNSPDQTDLVLRAWMGVARTGNVYILEGPITLLAAQARIGQPPGDVLDRIDALLVLSGAGPVEARIDSGVKRITLFFESANASGTTQAVHIQIIECLS